MAGQRWVGAGWVALSAVSFGAMAIFARVAFAGGVDVTAVLFLRFLIAGVVMAVVMAVTGRRWPSRRNAVVLALMGGVGYVAQSLCFFSALKYASAGLVALLLYLYPFLVSVLGVVFLRERLTTLIYSIYIVVGSRVLKEEDSLAAATVVMLAAALSFGLIVALSGPRFPQAAGAWGAVVAIALVSTVVAMVGFFAGIQRLGAADAATLSTLEPVVTFVLAALFLGEAVTLWQGLGGAVVLAAVIALARGDQPGSGAIRSR